jgi:hypothetical protein
MTGMKSFFLVADDIQQLAMGKTMAVGIYADHVILLNVPANGPLGVPALAKLHMMLTVRGLPVGEHDARAEIVLPDGSTAPRILPMKISALPEQAATFIFAFAPFPVPQEGRYLLRVHVAGETIENDFTIVRAVMPSEMALASGLPFTVTPAAAPKGSKTVFNRPKQPAPAKRAATPGKKAEKKRH